YTRLANGDRTDPGHHLAFRQMTVAHDALVAVRSLQIGMLAEKVRDLGLDRLGQQSTRPIAQDFGELIVEDSWLNQMDNVIVGHGISLLRWRSGGVKHPHDMPPSRFPPSPTFRDSSSLRTLQRLRCWSGLLASGRPQWRTSFAWSLGNRLFVTQTHPNALTGPNRDGFYASIFQRF